MSGLMHLLRGAGTPIKTGTSTAECWAHRWRWWRGWVRWRSVTGPARTIHRLSMQESGLGHTDGVGRESELAHVLVAACRDGFLFVPAEKVPEGLAGLSQGRRCSVAAAGADAVLVRTPAQVLAIPKPPRADCISRCAMSAANGPHWRSATTARYTTHRAAAWTRTRT